MKLINTIDQLNEIGEVTFDVRKAGYSKLNKEEYEQCKQILLNAGGEETTLLTHLHDDDWYSIMNLESKTFTFRIRIKPTKEDEIKQLQEQLAALGATCQTWDYKE